MRKPAYLKCLVICHGKSEDILISNIRSNLRLPIKVFREKNSSIELTSIKNVLNNHIFSSKKTFMDECDLEINDQGEIVNFKVFIILDKDGANTLLVNHFMTKEMFKNHWLYEYIVPIINDNNLDEILIMAGYSIDQDQKVKSYIKVFPGKNGDLEAFNLLRQRIRNNPKSNLIELLDYLRQFI